MIPRTEILLLSTMVFLSMVAIAFIAKHDDAIRRLQLTAHDVALKACSSKHGLPRFGDSARPLHAALFPFSEKDTVVRARDVCLMQHDQTYPGVMTLQAELACLKLEAKHGPLAHCTQFRATQPRLTAS